jgi:membrane protein DedA with SNARE-associated domain
VRSVYAAIFLGTLSTTILPIPEEATLLSAGYAARVGQAALPVCAGLCLLAVLLGDVSSYLVGRLLLAPVLRTRLGQRLLPESRRLRAEHVVRDKGWRAVVLARFLVALRGFIYLALGASRFPFPRFALVNVGAGVVEVGMLVGIGFALGELRGRVGAEIDLLSAAVLVLALFAPSVVKAWSSKKAAS